MKISTMARRGSEDIQAAKTCIFRLAAALIMLSFPGNSGADEFHYVNVLVGERPAGMGGAYTAVSDDPSGLYYNPAGVVYTPGKKLSASANAYYTTNKTYKKAIGNFDWKRNSSAILPNFFGIIQPLGKGMIGFSYAVPDSIIEDQDQVFNSPDIGRFIINFNVEDTTHNFGPSYSQKVSDNVSFGATLYFHYRRYQRISNQIQVFSDNSYNWFNRNFETEELGIKPLLGIQWSPKDKKYSVGFTLSRTILLNTANSFQSNTHLYTSTSADTAIMPDCLTITTTSDCRVDVSIEGKREYPLTAAVGFAYFPTNTLLFTGDLTYYTGTGQILGTFPLGNATGSTILYGEKRAFFNVALGAEYYLSQGLALRGGIYTNNANSPEVKSGQSSQDEHIDLYGLSFNLTKFTRGSSLTIGTVYGFGEGDAKINDLEPDTIQTVTFQSFMIYIGTSYFF